MASHAVAIGVLQTELNAPREKLKGRSKSADYHYRQFESETAEAQSLEARIDALEGTMLMFTEEHGEPS